MWLLSTDRTELKYFDGPDDMRLFEDGGYAILSHVWQGEEQTFHDIQALRSHLPAWLYGVPRSRASDKIRKCCILAESHGYRWVWIDTCCIDKASSSELSEAINSMFQWYRKAAVCYAYLADVSSHDLGPESEFNRSRWFTRGWTLQELIAPGSLLFLSSNWTILGSRTELVKHVAEITRVGTDILLHRLELGEVSVARRMSWASRRKTTRVEDEAYCLMGIFGVNMATIYGEGGNAFYRLQEEIMKISADQSLFAWGRQSILAQFIADQGDWGKLSKDLSLTTFNHNWHEHCLLASSSKAFEDSGDLEPVSTADAMEMARLSLSSAGLIRWKGKIIDKQVDDPRTYDFVVTPQGMRSTLPVVKLSAEDDSFDFCIAVLACESTRAQGAILGLLIRPISGLPRHQLQHKVYMSDVFSNSQRFYRIVVLSPPDGAEVNDERPVEQQHSGLSVLATDGRLRGELAWSTIHVLHRPLPHMWNNFDSKYAGGISTWGFHISMWSVTELQRWGFRTKDGPSRFPYTATSLSETFIAGTSMAFEAFTIYVGKEELKYNAPTTVATVLFTNGSKDSVRNSEFSSTSLSHLEDSLASNSNLPVVIRFKEEQNVVLTFGDACRQITLSFHRRSGRIRHKSSTFTPVMNYYLVDVSLSGSVYTKMRDEMAKRGRLSIAQPIDGR